MFLCQASHAIHESSRRPCNLRRDGYILRLSTFNLSDAMQKKSIYVAYTGGTIGMQRSEHGYIPVSGHLQRQLALMPEFHRPEMPEIGRASCRERVCQYV